MADIGDKLRSARKAKGMSIEDVEKITKIHLILSLLLSIEFSTYSSGFASGTSDL